LAYGGAQYAINQEEGIMSPNYPREEILERFKWLVEAAEAVVANWETGDLAGSVNNLESEAAQARDLLVNCGVMEESEEPPQAAPGDTADTPSAEQEGGGTGLEP
jgi:hypothetical protein